MREIGRQKNPSLGIWKAGIMYPETSYKNILEVTSGYSSSGEDAVAYLVRNYVHLLASGCLEMVFTTVCFPAIV